MIASIVLAALVVGAALTAAGCDRLESEDSKSKVSTKSKVSKKPECPEEPDSELGFTQAEYQLLKSFNQKLIKHRIISNGIHYPSAKDLYCTKGPVSGEKEVQSYGEIIKVDMFALEKAHYPDVLRSGGLGPCTAIAIYDPKSKSGYMMHLASYHDGDRSLFDKYLKRIQEDYKDLCGLTVFVFGNSIDSRDDEEMKNYSLADRPYILKTLRKYFDDSQIEVRWSKDDHGGELYFDTETGQFCFDEETFGISKRSS